MGDADGVTSADRTVLITGGAGYIGSALTGHLLALGYRVTVADRLDFGGHALIAHWGHPRFDLVVVDLNDRDAIRAGPNGLSIAGGLAVRFDAIVHLAAIVGLKACDAVGREMTWASNVDLTQRLFRAAEDSGVSRFVFASTYSNYGIAPDGEPVNEETALAPQSSYAESKIAAEESLKAAAAASRCAPILLRFATLFGVSPRTRFDLIINQFVLEALTKRELVIYDRTFTRSFVHVRDVCRAIELTIDAPDHVIHGEIFNVGGSEGNLRKDEVIAKIRSHVPDTSIRYVDQEVAGDMRDVRVSFEKIREELSFIPAWSVDDGIIEVRDALRWKVIADPTAVQHRNAHPVRQ